MDQFHIFHEHPESLARKPLLSRIEQHQSTTRLQPVEIEHDPVEGIKTQDNHKVGAFVVGGPDTRWDIGNIRARDLGQQDPVSVWEVVSSCWILSEEVKVHWLVFRAVVDGPKVRRVSERRRHLEWFGSIFSCRLW
jgi:hypothetical protein